MAARYSYMTAREDRWRRPVGFARADPARPPIQCSDFDVALAETVRHGVGGERAALRRQRSSCLICIKEVTRPAALINPAAFTIMRRLEQKHSRSVA